jgi:Tfp pilus assembly protein PilW
MLCALRLSRRRAAPRRGVSLIEGMVASVVLLIGLVGVFQGIMVASQQNTLANLTTRGAGVAAQARVVLDVMGPERVLGRTPGTDGLLKDNECTNSASVKALAGGLESVAPTADWRVRCVFDLDAYEKARQPADQLMPGYAQADADRFRRVLVWISRREGDFNVDEVAVVVSWNEVGRRRFVKQFLSFYDASSGPYGNNMHVEL